MTVSSILFFLKSFDDNKILVYLLSVFFATIAIFTREELYIIPILLLLISFYDNRINFKNLIYNFLKVVPYFTIVFLHMFLRKKFIPDADHLHIVEYSIKYGDNFISFGGLIKAFKSSFLPMGYLSSKYFDFYQNFFFITICYSNYLHNQHLLSYEHCAGYWSST